jgi:hypothetical protein
MAIDWNQLGSGLLNTGVGLFQTQLSKNAAQTGVANAQENDARRRAAYEGYASNIAGLAPGVTAGYTLRPATARTAFATSQVDPASGSVGYALAPGAQGLFDKYMTGAQKSIDLAGGFDPKALAAERLAAQQELLAPQRAKEEADLMRKLQKQGIVGLGSVAGSPTGAAQNPIAAALYGARAQADKEAAYASLREGESYLDNLLRRSQGLFTSAGNVAGQGDKALSTAADWTSRFTNAEANKTKATTDMLAEAFKAQREGAYDPTTAERILSAKNAEAKSSLLGSSSALKSGMGLFGDLAKNAGLFEKAGSWLGGLFGSGGSTSADWTSGFDVPSMDFGGGGWTSGYDLDMGW